MITFIGNYGLCQYDYQNLDGLLMTCQIDLFSYIQQMKRALSDYELIFSASIQARFCG